MYVTRLPSGRHDLFLLGERAVCWAGKLFSTYCGCLKEVEVKMYTHMRFSIDPKVLSKQCKHV